MRKAIARTTCHEKSRWPSWREKLMGPGLSALLIELIVKHRKALCWSLNQGPKDGKSSYLMGE